MKFVRKHWFLLTLMIALVIGFLLGKPFEPIADLEWLKWGTVLATMFLMAWPLAIGDLKQTITRPLGPLLASAINLGLIPLIAWPLSWMLGDEFGPGLIVVAATPATLASAAVWTRRAGGNDGIAIMVTIITNMLCFLVTPFWVFALTGNEIGRLELLGTINKLMLFVVLPIIVAQLVRRHRRSATWATENKPKLSKLALIGILIMVFFGAIKSGVRVADADAAIFSLPQLVLMLITVAAIHSGVLWFGLVSAKLLNLSRPDQIAVGIAGSQKTLMVGLSVALTFGMSILPLVAYHTLQLIIDTFVVERFRREQGAE